MNNLYTVATKTNKMINNKITARKQRSFNKLTKQTEIKQKKLKKYTYGTTGDSREHIKKRYVVMKMQYC